MKIVKQFNLQNFWLVNKFKETIKQLDENFDDNTIVTYREDGNIIIRNERQNCGVCSKKLYHNGTYKKAPASINILGITIRVGQQYHKECSHTGKISSSVLDKVLALQHQWQVNFSMLLSEANVSDEKISAIFRDGFGLMVCGHTINNWVKSEVNGIEVASPLTSEGDVAEYDEQWVKKNGINRARIVIKKYRDSVPLFDKVFENATKETIEQALLSVPELKKFKAFVMDMAPRYPGIFKKLFPNAKIQWCLFHLNKLIFQETKSNITIGRKTLWTLQIVADLYRMFNLFYHRENDIELLYLAQKRLNKFKEYRKQIGGKRKDIDKDIKEFEKRLIHEFWKFEKQYKLLRRRTNQKLKLRTYDEALKHVKDLYEKKELLSLKVMRKRIRYIVKNIEKFTPCLEDSDIPNTTNGLEAYFSSTLQKKAKKDFRSEEAINMRIKLSNLRKQGLLVLSPISFMQLMKYWHWILTVFTL